MTIILITGSRKNRDKTGIARALLEVLATATWPVTIMTGGQVSTDYDTGEMYGTDYLAGQIAKEIGLPLEEHPAHTACPEHGWEHSFRKHGRPGGQIRNQVMVDIIAARIAATGEKAICLAFPIGASPGTRGCMAKAKAARIPVTNKGRN